MKRILCFWLISLILLVPSGCAASALDGRAAQISVSMTRQDVEMLLGRPYFTHNDGAITQWYVDCYHAGSQRVFIFYRPIRDDRSRDLIAAFWIFDSQRQLLRADYNPAIHIPNRLGQNLTVDSAILSENFYGCQLKAIADKYSYCSRSFQRAESLWSFYYFPTDNGCCLVLSSGHSYEPDSIKQYVDILPTKHPLGEGISWIRYAEVTDYFTGETTVLTDIQDDTIFEEFQREYLGQKNKEEPTVEAEQ